jgi:hypothetical protein
MSETPAPTRRRASIARAKATPLCGGAQRALPTRRPPHWELIETAREPRRELADVFDTVDPQCVVLVDSPGTWLADRMTSAHTRLIDDALALESALEADCVNLSRAIDRSTTPRSLSGKMSAGASFRWMLRRECSRRSQTPPADNRGTSLLRASRRKRHRDRLANGRRPDRRRIHEQHGMIST